MIQDKNKEKKDSQRTGRGDNVIFVDLATEGFTSVYDEIPKLCSLNVCFLDYWQGSGADSA
jgi:hypothetical protein